MQVRLRQLDENRRWSKPEAKSRSPVPTPALLPQIRQRQRLPNHRAEPWTPAALAEPAADSPQQQQQPPAVPRRQKQQLPPAAEALLPRRKRSQPPALSAPARRDGGGAAAEGGDAAEAAPAAKAPVEADAQAAVPEATPQAFEPIEVVSLGAPAATAEAAEAVASAAASVDASRAWASAAFGSSRSSGSAAADAAAGADGGDAACDGSLESPGASGTRTPPACMLADAALAKSARLLEQMMGSGLLEDDAIASRIARPRPRRITECSVEPLTEDGARTPPTPASRCGSSALSDASLLAGLRGFGLDVDEDGELPASADVPGHLLKMLGEMWEHIQDLRARQDRAEAEAPDRPAGSSALISPPHSPGAPGPRGWKGGSIASTYAGSSASSAIGGTDLDKLDSISACLSLGGATPLASPAPSSRFLPPTRRAGTSSSSSSSAACCSGSLPGDQPLAPRMASLSRGASTPALPPPFASPSPSRPSQVMVPAFPVSSPMALSQGFGYSPARAISPACRPPPNASLVSKTVTVTSVYRLH
eukprot:TRINITY_DN27438_c0_g1_i1.p1 TRINITY_DN27438_c0_g1~~TRINITY_DN27438_c0_g1_i1.p1  ORF type:complete len:536 (+),score=116.36 TRINITY_DN27438_c0_g1_i1:1373-2980(+)